MVASAPVVSARRRAALPVGAHRRTRRPWACSRSTSARIVAVLPVPGPPVRIASRWATTCMTPSHWSSLGTNGPSVGRSGPAGQQRDRLLLDQRAHAARQAALDGVVRASATSSRPRPPRRSPARRGRPSRRCGRRRRRPAGGAPSPPVPGGAGRSARRVRLRAGRGAARPPGGRRSRAACPAPGPGRRQWRSRSRPAASASRDRSAAARWRRCRTPAAPVPRRSRARRARRRRQPQGAAGPLLLPTTAPPARSAPARYPGTSRSAARGSRSITAGERIGPVLLQQVARPAGRRA